MACLVMAAISPLVALYKTASPTVHSNNSEMNKVGSILNKLRSSFIGELTNESLME